MEMCYDGALVMPSSFVAMDEEEMTYTEGGITWINQTHSGFTGKSLYKELSSTADSAFYLALGVIGAGAVIGGIAGAGWGAVIGAIIGAGLSTIFFQWSDALAAAASSIYSYRSSTTTKFSYNERITGFRFYNTITVIRN